jgi:starch phosphorylase
MRILDALGFRDQKVPDHMNEGHSSLLALELLERSGGDPEEVGRGASSPPLNPVETGHDQFLLRPGSESSSVGRRWRS